MQLLRSRHRPRKRHPRGAKAYARFVSETPDILLAQFGTSSRGLAAEEAERRLEEYGSNEVSTATISPFIQLIEKFANPLIVVLLIIAAVSLFFGDQISAVIVSLMASMSVALTFIQEYRAGREAQRLSEMVRATCTVHRDGSMEEIKIRDIVPGDVIDLSAGDMIPADLRILKSKDLFINQSALTGESMPIEKHAASVQAHELLSISELSNIVFMGSSVVSGTAIGLVVRTGESTEFGSIAQTLSHAAVETSFHRGVRQLTWRMIRLMLILAIVIFCINAFSKGNILEALLFALAVAVGLTPEMLPMLVALNLSKGAIAMSKHSVIVKRLPSIQNFGAMDVLCTDKTGTLTLDKIVLERYCNVKGEQDPSVFRYAYINSFFQTGLKGLLDRTILNHETLPIRKVRKVDEIPFDFERKFMSVIVEMNGKHRMLTKGAPEEILKRCKHYKWDDKILPIEQQNIDFLRAEHDRLSAEGFRVLAVAYRDTDLEKQVYSKDDERDLILRGYIAFLDPPKPSAKETIDALRDLGVEVKILTGDNQLVTRKICGEVGLDVKGIVIGSELEPMSDADLQELVRVTTVFARMSPSQKERIIHALHANHHVVGYLGDGINDAPALKVADVGISVNNAVDIAKEAADIILLEKSLTVLKDGVIEGRRTFGNILKYVRMALSSNFGNMFSMTGASLLLPFLPMLPIQILLNNFLYDISQVAIITDAVDEEYLRIPRKWNVRAIERFTYVFGPLSSVFDFLTFGLLLWLGVSHEIFRTAWFIESFCTQVLVIHIIRTRKIPFFESKSSLALSLTSVTFVLIAGWLPVSPLAHVFGFVSLPPIVLLSVAGVVLLYLVAVQTAKSLLFQALFTD